MHHCAIKVTWSVIVLLLLPDDPERRVRARYVYGYVQTDGTVHLPSFYHSSSWTLAWLNLCKNSWIEWSVDSYSRPWTTMVDTGEICSSPWVGSLGTSVMQPNVIIFQHSALYSLLIASSKITVYYCWLSIDWVPSQSQSRITVSRVSQTRDYSTIFILLYTVIQYLYYIVVYE